VLAVPTWERKIRVLLVWASAVLFGRDIIPLATVQQPRAAFLAGGDPFAGAEDAARPELSVVRHAG
jgi:NADH dehydrogenase